nr:M10 family metallopeptidase [uncultured Gellertiella sp.]
MANVFNTAYTNYVNYLATNMAGGQLALGTSTITVNLDGLKDNLAQFNSANAALALWAATTGLRFVTVTGAAASNISFSNDSSGEAYTSWTGTHANIDVAQDWMSTWPVNLQWGTGSYGLQTFIHEIGHALGLSHGGPYNGSATYATDRIFDIDTWQYSVMSYFEQENYSVNGASTLFLNGPMIADIAAIKSMYGDLAVNATDTVYGHGSTVMQGVTDIARFPNTAFTIRDTGGYDTLDFSDATHGSQIDLRPGFFSNINGYVGNVAIAADTIIERVIGTSYNDLIIGNSADNTLLANAGDDTIYGFDGNDVIHAGAGNDTLYGGIGNDILQGALGADLMRGGAGDDSYYMDSSQDVVDELADGGAGIDTVYSSVHLNVSWAAVKGVVENLTLIGTSNINGAGNGLANTIIGNAGSNVLYGEGGNDILTGGAARDAFVFDTTPNSVSNVDRITDFTVIDDMIYLTGSIYTALGAKGFLAASAFLSNLTGLATHAADRIIYNSNDGSLYYDADGNGAGAAVKFAEIGTHLAVTDHNFYII